MRDFCLHLFCQCKLVRVGRLELPASCSQSRRATNCATPGHLILGLQKIFLSVVIHVIKVLFERDLPIRQNSQPTMSQRIPAFHCHTARTSCRHAQSKCDTNFATLGYSFSFVITRFFQSTIDAYAYLGPSEKVEYDEYIQIYYAN